MEAFSNPYPVVIVGLSTLILLSMAFKTIDVRWIKVLVRLVQVEAFVLTVFGLTKLSGVDQTTLIAVSITGYLFLGYFCQLELSRVPCLGESCLEPGEDHLVGLFHIRETYREAPARRLAAMLVGPIMLVLYFIADPVEALTSFLFGVPGFTDEWLAYKILKS